MKEALSCILTTSVSAAFEWQIECPYYTETEYTVALDGKEVYKGNTNVFSLFGLTPDTEYTLTSDMLEGELCFKTETESAGVSVRSFGALGDGITDDTVAIRSAINCLPKGGRLFFPKGIYLTGPVCLKSNITLELDENAKILGIPDKSKYPIVPGEISDLVTGEAIHFGAWEGNAVSMHEALIFAEYSENITIVGRGTVDGNAKATGWWDDPKNGGIGRPRLMFFNRCEGVRVHGITAENSPSWQLHPYFSKDVDFIDLKINAPQKSPNTDAIDPEACDRVDIVGCRFSVGDDCIAIKSGKIDIGRKYKKPASRHTVRNCLMQFGHGAVTLGSEMAGGVRELTVNRCIFEGTDRGLRIKTRRGRGKDATIDGVVFENLKMDGVKTPIVINMWYNCCDPDGGSEYVWSREKLPVDDRTPSLGAFTFRNMECKNCEAAACYCDGLPEMPIRSITVENVHFSYAEDAKPTYPAMRSFIEPFLKVGMYFDNVGALTVKNVTLDGVEGEPLIAKNVGEVMTEGLFVK